MLTCQNAYNKEVMISRRCFVRWSTIPILSTILVTDSANAAIFQIAGGFTSSTQAGGTQGNVLNTTTGANAGNYSIALASGANNPLVYQSNVNLNVTDPAATIQQIIFESGRIGGNVFGGNGNSLTFTPTWVGGGNGTFFDAPGAVTWLAPFDSNTSTFTSGTTFQGTNEFLGDPDQWRFTFPVNVTSVNINIEVNDYNGGGGNGNIFNDTFHVSFIITAPEPSRAMLLSGSLLCCLLRRRR